MLDAVTAQYQTRAVMTSTAPPKQITIRHPSPELAERLRAVARERGQSLNATVLSLLEEAVGLDARERWLERWATWTEADRSEFDEALQVQRDVDWELWR